MKYKRASNEQLLENGWDPEWIVPDPEEEGPYAVSREKGAMCGCCSSVVLGWTVVNLSTATGISVSWTHEDGEIAASDHANLLNAAWLEGFEAANVIVIP